MFAKPQEEHRWLEQLLGEWTSESECVMGPDQPTMKSKGRVSGRALGGLWFVLEMESEMPDGDIGQSVMTLGYDPLSGKFVGSFITSCMTYFWSYSGSLDEAKRKLVLDATGPAFDGSGMAQYQDSVELIDQDHWVLSSQVQDGNGNWNHFMTAHHRRTK